MTSDGSGESGVGAGPGGTGAFDATTPTRGERYLGTVEAELGPVTRLDVIALDFDDDYQEAGALAAVRELAGHARAVADLAPSLQDVIAPDEHGPFHGEVAEPDEGGSGAVVTITHVHRTDGEQ